MRKSGGKSGVCAKTEGVRARQSSNRGRVRSTVSTRDAVAGKIRRVTVVLSALTHPSAVGVESGRMRMVICATTNSNLLSRSLVTAMNETIAVAISGVASPPSGGYNRR